MTSAKGGNYAGQYPCDGRIDNLEPTLLITFFFSESGAQSEENHCELPTRQKVN